MTNPLQLRQATRNDGEIIWNILQYAIERRRLDGSNQWQDGYPNPDVVALDIQNHYAFVLENDKDIIAYAALIYNDEPAYEEILGQWLTSGDFYVVHRVAIARKFIGQGFSVKLLEEIENFIRQQKVPSLRMDTNFDNAAMLALLKKRNYHHCGEVLMRGAPRLAFEKQLLP